MAATVTRLKQPLHHSFQNRLKGANVNPRFHSPAEQRRIAHGSAVHAVQPSSSGQDPVDNLPRGLPTSALSSDEGVLVGQLLKSLPADTTAEEKNVVQLDALIGNLQSLRQQQAESGYVDDDDEGEDLMGIEGEDWVWWRADSISSGGASVTGNHNIAGLAAAGQDQHIHSKEVDDLDWSQAQADYEFGEFEVDDSGTDALASSVKELDGTHNMQRNSRQHEGSSISVYDSPLVNTNNINELQSLVIEKASHIPDIVCTPTRGFAHASGFQPAVSAQKAVRVPPLAVAPTQLPTTENPEVASLAAAGAASKDTRNETVQLGPLVQWPQRYSNQRDFLADDRIP